MLIVHCILSTFHCTTNTVLYTDNCTIFTAIWLYGWRPYDWMQYSWRHYVWRHHGWRPYDPRRSLQLSSMPAAHLWAPPSSSWVNCLCCLCLLPWLPTTAAHIIQVSQGHIRDGSLQLVSLFYTAETRDRKVSEPADQSVQKIGKESQAWTTLRMV